MQQRSLILYRSRYRVRSFPKRDKESRPYFHATATKHGDTRLSCPAEQEREQTLPAAILNPFRFGGFNFTSSAYYASEAATQRQSKRTTVLER